MELYPFQEKVGELILSGRSVILQAPTGSGKTRAALFPFFRAWEYGEDFPRKCIYSVPLRVLANQFWDEYKDRPVNFGFTRPMDVTVQTGGRPEDPRLEGNLIFTTIDQTLSNFLNIPYSLSLGQGNLNAGAVLCSYLVFDEFHLFDPQTSLPTTLHLLRLLRGIVPFIAMSATLSGQMIEALSRELDAEPLVLLPEELAAMPSQQKTRRVHTVEAGLTARAVLDRHKQRSIVICNTVERAQALFEELRRIAGSGVEVRLLHSRFLRSDREAQEEWLRREFGKDRSIYTVQSAILVATQVVEVGLDITCQGLHTELAPAASIVQRAGRCARYEGEEGDVWVYRLPVNKDGGPNYAPYLGIQTEICEKTWAALAERSGEVFDFHTELAIVNAAHEEADQHLLEGLRASRFTVAHRIANTIEMQEQGAARQLIRDVESRTVIVHPEPGRIENPWAYEGFGLFRGSLFGAFDGLQALAEELNEQWVLMTAEPLPEEESSRERTAWQWRPILNKDELLGALILAVNPRLATYSPEAGFRLGVLGDGKWASPLRERDRGWPNPYHRETFQEHVARMLGAYEHPFFDRDKGVERLPLAQELGYAARRMEQKYGWPAGTLHRLARWVIAFHDVGKLDVKWQDWAHRWQEEVGRVRGQNLQVPEGYLVAHTDYDEQSGPEQALNRKLSRMRPNHAASGAAAAMDWLLARTPDPALARAALTAIVRHHSAGANGRHGPFRAHPVAKTALKGLLGDVEGIRWEFQEGELSRRLIRPRRDAELLPYLLLARVVKMADQRALQNGVRPQT
ncbi:MAG: CRISPR-associated helicase Cas3' [Deltaproteobacteria bacterium]|nr:CRISPR-associated helicase Cas3' [Deltaproteobacteria bacterium]